jgi:hypothetical protein
MSDRSFQESEGSTSDSSKPECESPGNARQTPTASESSENTGPTYRSMKTYARLQPQSESIFSPEDFPARTSVSLDAVPGLAGNAADYGLSSPDLLASYDPDTFSWRTSQGSLFEEWELFSATWPRAGMTRNGTAYRLPPSAPHIYERGSSFWPTPIADSASGRTTPYSQGGVPLQVAVRWRTPQAGEGNGGGQDPEKRKAGGHSVYLRDQVGPGQLNPLWVEWLMGFPIGWTDCELSETPSSRKSPNTSAVESSKRNTA